MLAVAYFSLPYWAPEQIKKFLPTELQLQELNIQRPGFSAAKISNLELNIKNADGEIKNKLILENVTIHYSIFSKKLNSVSAENANIRIEPASDKGQAVFSNKILIPEIPVPLLDIKRLNISGLFVQDLSFDDFKVSIDEKIISVESTLQFLGMDFEIKSTAQTANNYLSQLSADIKQSEDFISLLISPDDQIETALKWKIRSSLDTNNYFPTEGLSKIEIAGSGGFDQTENISISLDPNFSINAPINLSELEAESYISSLMTEKGISFDTQSLNQPIELTFNNDSDKSAVINFNSDTSIVNLAKGELKLTAKHPIITNDLAIKQLSLNPSLELSDPSQNFSGYLTTNAQLSKIEFKQNDINFNTDSLEAKFAAPFQVNNSTLNLVTDDFSIDVGKSNFKSDAVSLKLPATNWLGKSEIQQNLTGDDGSNQRVINLKQSNSISTQIITKSESIQLDKLVNQLTLNKHKLSIVTRAKNASLTNQNFSTRNLVAHTKLNLQDPTPSGTISFDKSNFSNDQVSVEDFGGKINWSLDKKKVRTKGSLLYQSNKLPFEYLIDLSKDKHKITLKPVNLSALDVSQWLNPILKKYPSLTIEQGSIKSPKITGNPFDFAFEGKATLRNLNLSYDQLQLINLSLDEQLSSTGSLKGNTTGRIEKIEVASGIDITNVTFSLAHTIENFSFSKIQGSLLEGKLTIPNIDISPQGVSPLVVSLKNINFGQLLKALKSESLQIDGYFDFKLPISITDSAQTIKNGTFNSTRSGILSVDAGVSKDTNIAFQAISNFHYDSFSGTINYLETGVYQLQILLKGSNPDLYDGFPIELSMNVEGNLPNFLYSMLISGDIAKPIIDKYQSGELELPTDPQSL